jgi:tRNA-dihydrouridine synthase B
MMAFDTASTMGSKILEIGSVKIGSPFVQAALSGYSDWPMRAIARRYGASYALCEVMLDQFLLALKERRRHQHYLYIGSDEHPVGGQLMGAEPEQFAAGAARLVNAGFHIIDINFGCPVRKVLGRCRGGYHLSQPRVAIEIVRRTRDIVPASIPVTIKMRRGLDDSQESRDNFYAILDAAFAAGVAAITVHGRTVRQGYVGPSRWGFLAEVKQHVGDRTILGSGDLFRAEDCVQMIRQTGVDGVTIARGAIGNPWIFMQAQALMEGKPIPPPPSVREQAAVMREHYRLALQLDSVKAPFTMRKFGIKYASLHPDYESVRLAMTKVRSPHEWEALLETWYADDRPGNYPDPKVHRVQGETCD